MKDAKEIAKTLIELSRGDFSLCTEVSKLYWDEFNWYGEENFPGRHPITGEECTYVHLIAVDKINYKLAVEEGQEYAFKRVKEYVDSKKYSVLQERLSKVIEDRNLDFIVN